MRPLYKFSLLATLYFSQGLPYGFFSNLLPYILREQNVSLTGIGLAHLLTLPWGLKFLWAPWIDRTHFGRLGHRKVWIIALQLASSIILFVLAGLGFVSVVSLLIGYLLTNLFSATQDIATDGFAVQALKPSERGWGNGIQVAGYRLGMVGGGGAILYFYDELGYAGIYTLAGLLILFALLPVFWAKEPKPSPHVDRPDLKSTLKRPSFLSWIGLIAFLKFGDEMTSSMLVPMMKDLGLGLREIGSLKGVVASISGMAGAVFGGLLLMRFSRFPTVLSLGVLQAFACLFYLIPAFSGGQFFGLALGLEHFVGGMATTAIFTIMMDVCRIGHEGTDYTIQASAVVLAKTIAPVLAGYCAEWFGYIVNLSVSCALSLAAAFLFWQSYGQFESKLGRD